MLPIRIKACSESDLRMLGNLARNIQRVLPVTQADIDAAAALGEGWVVWKVIEVNDPIDNLRGGTQLVIKQNSITPGQNVRRVLIVSGPGGETVVIGPGPSPLLLPGAIADSLTYVKAYGGTEQRNLPDGYTAIEYVENTSGTYVDLGVAYNDADSVLSVTATMVNNAPYIFTARDSSAMQGIGGTSSQIKAYIDPVSLTSTTTKTAGHKYNFTLTANNGNATFAVEDETATTGDTQTTVYTVSQTQPTAHLCLFGNTFGNVSDAGMQIYGASYYVNGVAVRKLVPARKGAQIGLFDLVSRQFFTATQGSLLAGLDTTLSPTPTQPLDIVCNNGVLKYGFYYYNYNVARQLSTENYPAESSRSVSYSDGVLTCSITGSVYANNGLLPNWALNFTAGHKYACIVMAKGNATINLGVAQIVPTGAITGASSLEGYYTITNNYAWYAKLWECNADANAKMNIRIKGDSVGQYASFKDILLIDLTAIFGAGNEPTTPSDIIQSTVGVYTDGTVETINVHGKNLIDLSALTQGTLTDSGTINSSETNALVTPLIPISPSTTYTLKLHRTATQIYTRVCSYDSDGNFVSLLVKELSTTEGYKTNTFTTDATAKYVRVAFKYDSTEVQLEQGNQATTYEPYFDGGTATAEMLLKIDTYQDVQSILDGVVTRNVGVKVLDGTEGWGSTSQSAVYRWGSPVPFSLPNVCICSHYTGVSTVLSISDMPDKSVKTGYTGNSNVYIKDSSFSNNLSGFIQYLADQYAAGTPVIIVYPLATPTTESVAGQALQVTGGDNIVEITQASLSGLELEAEYQKA